MYNNVNNAVLNCLQSAVCRPRLSFAHLSFKPAMQLHWHLTGSPSHRAFQSLLPLPLPYHSPMFVRCSPSAHCQRSTGSTSTRPLCTPPAPSKPPVLLPSQGVARCSQSLEEPGGVSVVELLLLAALSVMLLSRGSLFGVRSGPTF